MSKTIIARVEEVLVAEGHATLAAELRELLGKLNGNVRQLMDLHHKSTKLAQQFINLTQRNCGHRWRTWKIPNDHGVVENVVHCKHCGYYIEDDVLFRWVYRQERDGSALYGDRATGIVPSKPIKERLIKLNLYHPKEIDDVHQEALRVVRDGNGESEAAAGSDRPDASEPTGDASTGRDVDGVRNTAV